MQNECIIRTENLTKIYGKGKGKNIALDNVSIKIYSGEFLVILGHSASGKSTLLNLISGMDTPSSGKIFFRDNDLTKFSSRKLTNYRRDNIAFIFQFFNLLYDLSAIGNVVLPPGSNKKYKEIKNLFNKLGIKDKEFETPKNLSGGQQQRVAIARALNKKSDVIICDEPTGALDEDSGKAVLALLEKVNMENKKTIVLVTHTSEIAKMADRVIYLKNGKLVEERVNDTKIKASEVNY